MNEEGQREITRMAHTFWVCLRVESNDDTRMSGEGSSASKIGKRDYLERK